MKKTFQTYLGIAFFSLVISTPIILPYFHSGYFPTHDGEWAIVRMGDMFRSLRDMQFPVRYSGNLNFSYGYPLFNFAYPFPYYFGVLLHSVGIGFIQSAKIIFALSVPLSVFFMFLFSREFWKNNSAGIISSVLYAYLPYRFVDLFVRGSIGESISFVLFPLLLYLIIRISKNKSISSLVIGVVTLAILITTHNIMTVLFMPILLIFIFLQISKDRKLLMPFFVLLFLAGLLSAFFWIPALMEKNLIRLSIIPIADRNLYFVNFFQLIIPKWGYGLPVDKDGFSYQLGFPHVIIFIFSIFASISMMFGKIYKKGENISLDTLVLLIVSILFLVLLFPQSEFVWEITPFLSEINYPWTLLLPIGFLMCFLAGFVTLQRKLFKYFGFLMCFLAVMFFFPYAKPVKYIDKGEFYYLTNQATTTSSQELMPLWVKDLPTKSPENKVESKSGSTLISDLKVSSDSTSFSIIAGNDDIIRLNTIYYPGWTIYVDNVLANVSFANKHGVMEFHVKKGQHKINAEFGETPIRLFADLASVVGVLALAIVLHPRLKKFIYKI